MPSQSSTLLPLVLGVVGHRDPREDQLPRLQQQVETILGELRKECPHSPIWLLCSLAEGCERIVAQVALDVGAELVATLPMPRELYEHDFTSHPSLVQFRTLLEQSLATIELPLVTLNSLADSVQERMDTRAQQYAQSGAFVALHSQILIALWDGKKSTTAGDVGQIIEFMIDGVPEPYAPPTCALYDRESGPVYHMLVEREGDQESNPASPAIQVLYPGEPNELILSRRLQARLRRAADAFNRDVKQIAGGLQTQRAVSRHNLLRGDNIPTGYTDIESLGDHYALVDSLASHFQRGTLRTMKVLLFLSFLAIVLLQSCLAKVANASLLLPLYALVILFAVCYYWWAKWSRQESKFLDYRALAEGLRVQIFWRLAGLNDCVADHYLRRQRGVLEWVRNAIRVWTMAGVGVPPDPSRRVTADHLKLLQQCWLQDQSAYFNRSALRNRRRARQLSWTGKSFVLAGFLLAMIDAWLLSSPLLVVAAIVMPIVAGLIVLYVNKRALQEHANQYDRMGKLFSDAARRLDERLSAGDIRGGQKLIFEIGQEALAENADWVILHRDRPIESPNIV